MGQCLGKTAVDRRTDRCCFGYSKREDAELGFQMGNNFAEASFKTPETRKGFHNGLYTKFGSFSEQLPRVTVTSATPLSLLSPGQLEYLNSINVIHGGELNVPCVNAGEYMLHLLEQAPFMSTAFAVFGEASLSYRELIDQVTTTATLLRKLPAVRSNSTVIFLCSNCVQLPALMISAFLLRIPIAICNPSAAIGDIMDDLEPVKPVAIFCTRDRAAKVARVQSAIESVQYVVAVDCEEPPCEGFLTLSQLQSRANPLPTSDAGAVGNSPPRMPLSANARCAGCSANPSNCLWRHLPALIVWTVGRTGRAKPLQLTHHSIVASAVQMEIWRNGLFGQTSQSILGVLPFYHSYGLSMQLLLALVSQGSLTVLPRMEPTTLLRCMQLSKVTCLVAAPPVIEFMTTLAPPSLENLEQWRFAFSLAAPLSASVVDKFFHRYPNVVLCNGYGLSETTSLTHCAVLDRHSLGTVGTPLLGVESKVVDLESGVALGAKQRGEICLRGCSIALNCCRDNQAQTYLDNNGWLHTGDIGYFDSNRFLFIVATCSRQRMNSTNGNLTTTPDAQRVCSVRNMGLTPLTTKHSAPTELKTKEGVFEQSSAEGSDTVFLD